MWYIWSSNMTMLSHKDEPKWIWRFLWPYWPLGGQKQSECMGTDVARVVKWCSWLEGRRGDAHTCRPIECHNWPGQIRASGAPPEMLLYSLPTRSSVFCLIHTPVTCIIELRMTPVQYRNEIMQSMAANLQFQNQPYNCINRDGTKNTVMQLCFILCFRRQQRMSRPLMKQLSLFPLSFIFQLKVLSNPTVKDVEDQCYIWLYSKLLSLFHWYE